MKLSFFSRLQLHPEFKTRLEDETKILKTLDHPNIIGFRSQGKSEDGNLCLVMESGQQSLSDLNEDRLDEDSGPYPAENILKVAKALASALHYLHTSHHMLHGDLKSANVLIKGDFDQIKLCDFGVTVKLNDKLVVEDPGECYVGTECWSAPEVIRGDKTSNKTDIFSYGLVLW
ncbi:UNVERIFIED_CONTAM: hypothetical protein GTU68_028297 [Idotea baltica]|nr:hypothetical protein [Idotea baltica]